MISPGFERYCKEVEHSAAEEQHIFLYLIKNKNSRRVNTPQCETTPCGCLRYLLSEYMCIFANKFTISTLYGNNVPMFLFLAAPRS